ncbi:TfoX/Sxy family protein [Algicella marina]|uniref:Competence protein TfoX n=1 Tax=Algicella marina TaxID=2683284 RepID=A0A6P1T0U7_9RHOB|nr:TfoX/Sxy family protein [Algicella marina]QHQ34909.1 competence protein TfoX [Algicella marina]
MSRVSDIRNIGPKSEAGFRRAGFLTAEQVREAGADDAYRRLMAAGTRPHFIGYYALVLGLQGRHWNDITPDEKAELRSRFDALVGSTPDSAMTELGVELNRLGIRI